MAVNPDLIKLIAISIGGLVLLPIGPLIARRSRKKKMEQEMGTDYSDYSPDSTSGDPIPNEDALKNYILQYKAQYDREAIKQALVGSGHAPENVDKALDKYM